jgi:hypothetical protein
MTDGENESKAAAGVGFAQGEVLVVAGTHGSETWIQNRIQ